MNNRNLTDYEEKYNDKDHYEFETFQVKFRRRNTLTQLNRNIHNRILEIGSGMDPLFQYLNDYIAYTVVEPSDIFHDLAKSLSEGNKRISLLHDYIENITTDEKYDFIVISSLLHEIENPKTILKVVKNLCNSNTIVYINVPNARSFHRLLALEAGMISSIYNKSENQIKFQQAYTFDMTTLEKLVTSSGFTVIESGSYFVKPFTHSQMRMLLSNEIVGVNVLEGFEKMIKYCPDLGSEIFLTCMVD